jgi:hypothetical protein
MVDSKKRQNGRFYTEGNPFVLKPFKDWAKKANLRKEIVLEPFAGANNIIRALQMHGYAKKFRSFDIDPRDRAVEPQDTLELFPSGYSVCVTNPPWLARNSAKRRGLDFPNTIYDDLYKHALEKCLFNCDYVAALIPATYLRSGDLRKNLEKVIFLQNQKMFSDTENPVCLALFSPNSNRVEIFNDELSVGFLDALEKRLPIPAKAFKLKFNDPEGQLGLIAIDNTREPSIRFVPGKQLEGYQMKQTSRMITRIQVGDIKTDDLIGKLNKDLQKFRTTTGDVFLTPFKGLRKDGYYRRRIDYSLARDFIAQSLDQSRSLGF